MSTTYAQRQTTAQKKDALSASSVLDNSSQSEALQRKANMVDNNVIQCYEVVPCFRENHTGNTDDESVKKKFFSRQNNEKNIKKNSVLIDDAFNALRRYSEELDGCGNKWQPIRNVPCVTADSNGKVKQEQVSVWLTDETEARLGHVDENECPSVKNDGILKFRTKIKSCEYSGIKNAVDSRKLPTVPQKPEDPYQKIVEKLQSGLESVFVKYITKDEDWFCSELNEYYDLSCIKDYFEDDVKKREKKDFYLKYVYEDIDSLIATFKTELETNGERRIFSWFPDGSFTFDKLQNVYILELEIDALGNVWEKYKEYVSECI